MKGQPKEALLGSDVSCQPSLRPWEDSWQMRPQGWRNKRGPSHGYLLSVRKKTGGPSAHQAPAAPPSRSSREGERGSEKPAMKSRPSTKVPETGAGHLPAQVPFLQRHHHNSGGPRTGGHLGVILLDMDTPTEDTREIEKAPGPRCSGTRCSPPLSFPPEHTPPPLKCLCSSTRLSPSSSQSSITVCLVGLWLS